MDDRAGLGYRLRLVRERNLGLDLQEMASRLGLDSADEVAGYENDECKPSIAILRIYSAMGWSDIDFLVVPHSPTAKKVEFDFLALNPKRDNARAAFCSIQ